MLSQKDQAILDHAIRSGVNIRKCDWAAIQALQSLEKNKIHKKLGLSLFNVASQKMKMSRSMALSYIAVARKCLSVPELGKALASQKISVWIAYRFVSVVTPENATAYIDYACTHTERELDLKVRGADPKALPKDKIKVLTNGHVEITTVMTLEDYNKLERVKALEAQKQNVANLGTLVGICAETHLEKHDPVRKAARSKMSMCKQTQRTRQRSAAQKHAVNLRDQGRCTFVDENGQRCNSEWWTEHHHIKHFANGGSNEPENITTLCAQHHDLIHQLPVDGQVAWFNY